MPIDEKRRNQLGALMLALVVALPPISISAGLVHHADNSYLNPVVWLIPILWAAVLATLGTSVAVLRDRPWARAFGLGLGLGTSPLWLLATQAHPGFWIGVAANALLLPLLFRRADRTQARQSLSLTGLGALLPLPGFLYIGLGGALVNAVDPSRPDIAWVPLALGAVALLIGIGGVVGMTRGKTWGLAALLLSSLLFLAPLPGFLWGNSRNYLVAIPGVILSIGFLLCTIPFWGPVFRFLRKPE